MMTVLLFGFFMFSLYRGGVLSRLAVRIESHPINSLEDIPGSDFELGTIGGGTNTHDYFELADEDTIQGKLWKKTVKTNLLKDNLQGLNEVMKHPEYAFFMYEKAGKDTPWYPCLITDVGRGYMKVRKNN